MEVNCFINPPPLLHPYPSAGQSLHVFMLCALKSARCYTCARASFGKKENCLLPRPAKCLILSVMSATFITGWPYSVLVFKNESLKNLTLVLWHRPQGTQKNRRGGEWCESDTVYSLKVKRLWPGSTWCGIHCQNLLLNECWNGWVWVQLLVPMHGWHGKPPLFFFFFPPPVECCCIILVQG